MQSSAPSSVPRIHDTLRRYWEGLPRNASSLPMEEDIDPAALAELWDDCFLIKALESRNSTVFSYTLLGKSLIDAIGEDITNEEVSSRLISPASPPLHQRCLEAVKQKIPVTDEGEFTNRRGMVIKYRSILLPLASPESDAGYILGGMRWRSY